MSVDMVETPDRPLRTPLNSGRTLRSSAMPRRRLALLGALWLAAAACASPVGAVRVDPAVAHRQLARSATTTGEPSWPTRNHLAEHDLLETFDTQPEAAIAELHRAMVASGGDPGLLFALAELSFLYGQATTNPTFHLAAAVYAYAFLFPEGSGVAVGRFDPRLRIAADLYNLALTGAFASKDRLGGRPPGRHVPPALRTASRWPSIRPACAPGTVSSTGSRRRRSWRCTVWRCGTGGRASALPLAAATRPIDPARPGRDLVAPRLQVPVTAFLRIPGTRRALVEGRPLAATLELHLAWDAEAVSIAGEPVPLEIEPSAALALTFTDVPTLQLELLGFLGRLAGVTRPPLVSVTPYRPGLVPVVFVHGTQSSVVRWAEMYNRLQADPEIRRRFQFWFFQYDSGQPVALSSLQLREALTAAVARLDPEGKDPALRRMVLDRAQPGRPAGQDAGHPAAGIGSGARSPASRSRSSSCPTRPAT